MQRIRQLGLALLAIFALGAVAATTASAEETGNPDLLTPATAKFTSRSFEGALVPHAQPARKITCTADTDSGEFKTIRIGSITIDFTGCAVEEGKVRCRSLGDALGTILTGGVANLVDVKVGTVLTLAILINIVNLHIECQGGVLFTVSGSVIGVFDNVTSGTPFSSAKILFTQSGGIQTIRECELPKELCTAKQELQVQVNGEPAESAGEETVDEIGSLSGAMTVDF
jgi:hypothetical protein